MKKMIVCCGALIMPIMIFNYTLEQKYEKLHRDKVQTEANFEAWKKRSALWGEGGYVGRNLKPFYTTVYTTQERYTALANLFETPFEVGRLILAYPLFFVTVPVVTIVGIADWFANKEADEQKLKESADNLEKIEEEIKKTDEDMHVAKLQQLHRQCETICRE